MELRISNTSELTDEDLVKMTASTDEEKDSYEDDATNKRRKQLSIIFYVWHRKPLDSSYTTAVLELSVILATRFAWRYKCAEIAERLNSNSVHMESRRYV
ncbi:conserved hypothetical protein [Trichinella spiralis]|uniref:hypothetical protein n=1 Tax=Trichinella spiralis TaxID=6334 RepID=UPI0001EFD665|nr:conserved hypothetical protein [Trichinella spiralis]